ncbi:hypothetical protein KI387_041222, partial [Taxus chinensis]
SVLNSSADIPLAEDSLGFFPDFVDVIHEREFDTNTCIDFASEVDTCSSTSDAKFDLAHASQFSEISASALAATGTYTGLAMSSKVSSFDMEDTYHHLFSEFLWDNAGEEARLVKT